MYSQQMLALLELSNRDKSDVIKTLWGLYPSFVYLKKKMAAYIFHVGTTSRLLFYHYWATPLAP